MTMYWLYDLPNATLGALIVGAFLVGAEAGLFASRPAVRRLLGGSAEHNDIVSSFFGGIGVFYGLALGLIAVGTWENFSAVDGLVTNEASTLAGLYRDFDGYPQPLRGELEDRLRDYTRTVVEAEWPAHQKGEAPEAGTLMLDAVEDRIMAFDPGPEREKIVHAEVLHTVNTLVEQRRQRLAAVGTGLPASLWWVIAVGAWLNIGLTYLYWVENRALHAILIALLSTFIGLLIFLTVAMDNPFRGQFSISPDVFRTVLEQVMKPAGPR